MRFPRISTILLKGLLVVSFIGTGLSRPVGTNVTMPEPINHHNGTMIVSLLSTPITMPTPINHHNGTMLASPLNYTIPAPINRHNGSMIAMPLNLTITMSSPINRHNTTKPHSLELILSHPSTVSHAAAPEGYQCFAGPAEAYPGAEHWIGFEAMWENQYFTIQHSCASDDSWGGLNYDLHDPAAVLKDFQMQALHDGVSEAAATTGLPKEFILAIMLQESHGCPSARTTNNGVRNPGLMQCHNGDEFVGNNKPEAEQIASIKHMIMQGANGTPHGDGLKQCADNQGGNIYAAARQYNSGSVRNLNNLNDPNGATASYVCDIANHLKGTYVWDAFVRMCQ